MSLPTCPPALLLVILLPWVQRGFLHANVGIWEVSYFFIFFQLNWIWVWGKTWQSGGNSFTTILETICCPFEAQKFWRLRSHQGRPSLLHSGVLTANVLDGGCRFSLGNEPERQSFSSSCFYSVTSYYLKRLPLCMYFWINTSLCASEASQVDGRVLDSR